MGDPAAALPEPVTRAGRGPDAPLSFQLQRTAELTIGGQEIPGTAVCWVLACDLRTVSSGAACATVTQIHLALREGSRRQLEPRT